MTLAIKWFTLVIRTNKELVKMIKPVAQNLVAYVKDELDDEINNIAEHGCEDGVHGMIKLVDCLELYEEFEEEIWEKLNEFAENSDMSVLFLLNKEKRGISDADSFKTKALWLAVELICQDIAYDEENDEIEEEE